MEGRKSEVVFGSVHFKIPLQFPHEGIKKLDLGGRSSGERVGLWT